MRTSSGDTSAWLEHACSVLWTIKDKPRNEDRAQAVRLLRMQPAHPTSVASIWQNVFCERANTHLSQLVREGQFMITGDVTVKDLDALTKQFGMMAESLAATLGQLNSLRAADDLPADLAAALNDLIVKIAHVQRQAQALAAGGALAPVNWQRRWDMFLQGLSLLDGELGGTMH